jgi:hypothetical protein
MTYAHRLSRGRQGRFIAVLLTAAATAAIMLFAFQGSAAQAEIDELDAGCVSGAFCAWTGTFYTGEEFNFTCGTSYGTGFELRSAKNRCSMNVHIGWNEGGSTNWKACMTPGGERPEPGRFNNIVPFGC